MRIAAGIEYDGSHFHGWQQQHGQRTVQDCIERALTKVADHPVRVRAAGRTDSGVHAVGQVIHFETAAERPLRSWVLGANAHLPRDVTLTWARFVDAAFHARHAAVSRRYRYVIFNRWIRPAVLASRVSWDHRPLQVERMQEAAEALKGKHDFSSFRALACQAKSPIRTLHDIAVTRHRECIYIDLHADGFLHRMVRNIAGVLMTVGAGERPIHWVRGLLATCDRTQGGITAPPTGLYLVHVGYAAEHGLANEPHWPVFC